MNAKETLHAYYQQSPFGSDGGASKNVAYVYAGPYLIKIPNTPLRKKLVIFHDFHHLVTDYNNSRIGEGEVSAWELGTGVLNTPVGLFFSLAGFATGLTVSFRRMYEAYLRGRASRNLYRLNIDDLLSKEFSDVRSYAFPANNGPTPQNASLSDKLSFLIYAAIAAGMYPFIFFMGWVQNRMGCVQQ